MLAQIPDLRLCGLMSLGTYVCTLMSCAFLSAPLCRVSLLEAMYLTSPYLSQITDKFNLKMQSFKRVLDLNCKQKEN